MTIKSIINGFINLRISFNDIIVDVVVFRHSTPKCVKKKKRKRLDEVVEKSPQQQL
jgi:hypothetical protein